MRENRTHGSEGGESGSTGLPYPYHRVVPHVFRAYRQLGQESVHLHDAVTVVAMLHPELFETTELAGDVETGGELTTGSTVFDRRLSPSWRPNMEVAMGVDESAVTDCILRGLARAG